MSDVSTELDNSTAIPTATKENIKVNIDKYWNQRYRIFLKFDDGIQLDNEGWFSITPERIGHHIAKRFSKCNIIVDLFSGYGGNCIQFALNNCTVLGIEHDLKRIDMARHNSRIYGVEKKIDFFHGDVYADFLNVNNVENIKNIGVDGIFMSPPWGGPEYLRSDSYDVTVFKDIVDKARKISKNVGILVPRNIQMQHVFDCFGECEVEDNYLGGKLKTKTIYFGHLMKNNTNNDTTEIQLIPSVQDDEQQHNYNKLQLVPSSSPSSVVAVKHDVDEASREGQIEPKVDQQHD